MPPLTPGLDLTLETLPLYLLLVLAGVVASSINAVAGGGTLISFPVMVLLGVPPVAANASNAVALWPGAVSSALGFLPQLKPVQHHLKTLILPTVTGALVGAWLLVHTSERTFNVAVPILLFIATILLAFQPQIKRWSMRDAAALSAPSRALWPGLLGQFLVSVYGGYFGAGMGILMLAVMGTFVEGNLHQLNAVKAWLGLLINLVASLFFFGMGLIWLGPALAVMVGAILGGFVAARISQRLNPESLRKGIVVLGIVMTLWFAAKSAA